MRPTLSLLRREFTAYFLSPIAYVVLTAFLVVTGHLFYLALDLLTTRGHRGTEYPMQVLLGDEKFWLVFLFIPPLLTMRSIAEERGAGTLEVLMTAPIRDWQIVFCKFAACYLFYLLMWVPTLAYLPVLLDLHPTWKPAFSVYGIALVSGLGLFALAALVILFGRLSGLRFLALLLGAAVAVLAGYLHYTQDAEQIVRVTAGIDPWPAVTSYVGVALVGAMFLALGLWVSSLVRSQLVAAIVSLVLSLPFIVAGFWQPDLDTGSAAYQVIYFVSVPLHFARDFTRGQIDTRHVVLYLSVAAYCLFMTVRSLESRRWR